MLYNNFLSCCVCRLFFRLNAAEDRKTSLILLCFIFIIMLFYVTTKPGENNYQGEQKDRAGGGWRESFSRHSITTHLITPWVGGEQESGLTHNLPICPLPLLETGYKLYCLSHLPSSSLLPSCHPQTLNYYQFSSGWRWRESDFRHFFLNLKV